VVTTVVVKLTGMADRVLVEDQVLPEETAAPEEENREMEASCRVVRMDQ